MAEDDLPDAPWTEAKAAPVDVPDAPWTKHKPAAGPMPGPLDSLIAGLQRSIEESGESAGVLRGQKPTVPSSVTPSPAAEPMQWGDVLHPSTLASKGMYQLGASAPTLGGGIAGGIAGGAAAGPPGAIAGGAGGAGLGAAFQAIGPVFGEELRKSPNDPDGAWNRAVSRASTSGVFSALGWAAFPLKIAQGPLKNLAFQAFGVQPAIGTAGEAAQNVLQGKPVETGLAESYPQQVLGTAVPALGHRLVSRAIDPIQVRPAAPSIDEAALKGAQDNISALAKETPKLHRDAQEAYDKWGLDSPESKYANYKLSQHEENLRQANADFTDIATPAKPDPMLFEKIPVAGPWLRERVEGFKRTFMPEMISNLSFDSQAPFRAYNAAKAQGRDSITHEMDKIRYAFVARPYDANVDFIKSHTRESQAPLPPDLQPHSDILRRLMSWTNDADRDAGLKFGYKEDYLPREYEKPENVQSFINQQITNLGRANFLKGRTFDYLQQALDAGYKLKGNANPIDLAQNRLIAGSEMRAKMELVNQLSDMGAAKKLENDGQRSNFEKAGWQIIKNPAGDLYAIHPDVTPIWKNAVDAKGLWNRDDAIGNVFRKWMFLKNHWVPIKLGLSAFHLLHVAHIALNDAAARGWTKAKTGDITGAIGATAQGFTGWFHFPEGQKLREAWLTPEWRQTPEQKALNQLAIEGGFSPQLSEQLRSQGATKFKEAWAQNNPLQYVPRGALQGLSFLQKQLFEKWIPNLKSAAYVREAQALFERRPDIQADSKLRGAALGTIAKSVDNRFGEMFYSNLFWNRTLKDAGIGSFLSLGWNLGFVREFGGGALEPFLNRALMTPTQEAVNAAKSKTSFALFYMTTAMALNAAMTKGMTGDNPEGMDYFMPRFGGTNPDGSPRRLSNMYYTREVPMLKKHVEEQYGNPIAGVGEMIWNKMLLQPVKEMYENKDYYGYNIMDPASPLYTKVQQMTKYILSDQFNPITIMGAKRALKASGKWDDKNQVHSYMNILTQPEGQLAMLGFGPAPAYVSKTPAQNQLSYLFAHYVSPIERPQAERKIMEERKDARNALELARQQNDEQGMAAATKRMAEAGISGKGRKVLPGSADIYQFSRLPFTIQTQFLLGLGPQDFKRYYPKAAKLAKGNQDVMDMVRRYYQ